MLTEPTFFDGALEHLAAVRAAVELPLLRKDFIVDAISDPRSGRRRRRCGAADRRRAGRRELEALLADARRRRRRRAGRGARRDGAARARVDAGADDHRRQQPEPADARRRSGACTSGSRALLPRGRRSRSRRAGCATRADLERLERGRLPRVSGRRAADRAARSGRGAARRCGARVDDPRQDLRHHRRRGRASWRSSSGRRRSGFVFWPGSPRFVDVERARAIVAALPPFVTRGRRVRRSAVDDGARRRATRRARRRAAARRRERRATIAALGRRVIKAVAVRDRSAPSRGRGRARRRDGAARRARSASGAAARDGRSTGRSPRRSRARRPVILSGGLTPENVRRGRPCGRPVRHRCVVGRRVVARQKGSRRSCARSSPRFATL